jgi:hypothetical protein
MTKLQFNPNANCSKVIESEFNGCISSGIDVYIAGVDSEGVTLGAWRYGCGHPKAFTLTLRGKGVCVGGYLKKELTDGFDLRGKKAFIEICGTMRNRTIKLKLADAARRMACPDVAMVSFDPQYKDD